MKRTDLLTIDSFRQIDDEKINMQVSYRIESLKRKKDLVTNRLTEILNILEDNNPKLVEHIHRVIKGRNEAGQNMGMSPGFGGYSAPSYEDLLHKKPSTYPISDRSK